MIVSFSKKKNQKLVFILVCFWISFSLLNKLIIFCAIFYVAYPNTFPNKSSTFEIASAYEDINTVWPLDQYLQIVIYNMGTLEV